MLLGTCYLSLSHKLIIILASILSCLLAFCGLLWALPAYSLYPQIPSPGAPVEYPGRRNIISHNQWKYPDTLAIRYFFKHHLCSTWSPGPMTKTPPSTILHLLGFPRSPSCRPSRCSSTHRCAETWRDTSTSLVGHRSFSVRVNIKLIGFNYETFLFSLNIPKHCIEEQHKTFWST